MNLTEIHARRQPGRTVTGMAAVLLPFTESGDIAEDAYAACLQETVAAGLTPAVNMDTGYVNLLTDAEKERVLQLARQTLDGAPFVAGAYIEGQDGDVADLYRREIARIAEHGGTPILFQTARLHDVPAARGRGHLCRAPSRTCRPPTPLSWARCSRPTARSGRTKSFEGILQSRRSRA